MTTTAKKQEQKPKSNQLGAQTGLCPVEKRPGVPEGKHAWQTKLTKNQHEQEGTKQYQGHLRDAQLVPKYFRRWNSQATLQGIKINHDGHTKLK